MLSWQLLYSPSRCVTSLWNAPDKLINCASDYVFCLLFFGLGVPVLRTRSEHADTVVPGPRSY
jgi:hypothetical protein